MDEKEFWATVEDELRDLWIADPPDINSEVTEDELV